MMQGGARGMHDATVRGCMRLHEAHGKGCFMILAWQGLLHDPRMTLAPGIRRQGSRSAPIGSGRGGAPLHRGHSEAQGPEGNTEHDGAVQCSTVRYYTVHTAQYCTVLYSTAS